MEPPAEPPAAPPETCASCGRPLKPEASFCSHCGLRRGDAPVDRAAQVQAKVQQIRRQQSGLSGIHSVILLYITLLGGQGLSFLVSKVTDDLMAEAVGTAILSMIIVVSAIVYRREVSEPGARAGFGGGGYALILAASVPIVWAVAAYSHGLHRVFRLHSESELKAFEGRSLGWAFLLFAAAPAVFEELGFRGVIYSLLRRSLDPRESILLSAVAFGLLHLSVPMLVTHVPLGLYLGWLRHRSGSLYPSMFAHFLHTALLIVGDTGSLLPGSGTV